jgi:7SK snRNA methylphosphate capping enzyme
MAIARDMCAKSILGIDIDPSLINKARKTVKQYANRKVPSAMATPNPGMDPSLTSLSKTEQLFPQSLPLLFGPLDPTKPDQQYQQQPKIPFSSQIFPNNIKFLCDNYVFESDELLDIVQPEFDSILCLSTTKWLQLNFGDEGLKRAFKRMFKQLRPNGVLILEPQGMASYSKKARKINDTTKEHFKNMKLKPEMFVDYLTTEVGFTGGEVVAVPEHSAAGFRRPIHVSFYLLR